MQISRSSWKTWLTYRLDSSSSEHSKDHSRNRSLRFQFVRNFWGFQSLRFLTCIHDNFQLQGNDNDRSYWFFIGKKCNTLFVACLIDVGVIEGNSTFDFNWFQLILIDRTARCSQNYESHWEKVCYPCVFLRLNYRETQSECTYLESSSAVLKMFSTRWVQC